jgi:hypothetical protein
MPNDMRGSSRRRALGCCWQAFLALSIPALAFSGYYLVERFVLRVTPVRCDALSVIKTDLHDSMTRPEIEAVVARHQQPFINRVDGKRHLELWTHIGLLRTCNLVLEFDEQQRLRRSRLSREDF